MEYALTVGTDCVCVCVFVTPVFVTTGRNRWVEYAPAVGTDYDGSMVPAEWYGWLHYKADETPIQVSRVPDLYRGGGGGQRCWTGAMSCRKLSPRSYRKLSQHLTVTGRRDAPVCRPLLI